MNDSRVLCQDFFNMLRSNIDNNELKSFFLEAGFCEDFLYPLSEYEKILSEDFPVYADEDYLVDLASDIYGYGIDMINSYSFGVRIFFFSLFLYCHRRIESMGDQEERFYYFYILSFLNVDDKLKRVGLRFLYWLHLHADHAGERPRNNDFFLLFSIFVLERSLGIKEINITIKKLSNFYYNDFALCIVSESDGYEDRWVNILHNTGAIDMFPQSLLSLLNKSFNERVDHVTER